MTQQITEEQLREIEEIVACKKQGDSINSHDGLCADDLRDLVVEVRRLRPALVKAIREADGWHDDDHGGPAPNLDAERALIQITPSNSSTSSTTASVPSPPT